MSLPYHCRCPVRSWDNCDPVFTVHRHFNAIFNWWFIKYFIAICAKVGTRANQSFFASSEAETCSAHISTTNRSFAIILVDLECTRWYLSHNVVYALKNPGIIFICEWPLIRDCAASGAISWLKFLLIKLDISVGCYFTVHRAKRIAELHSVLPKNKETLHHTATPFFVLPLHHIHPSRFLSFYATLF